MGQGLGNTLVEGTVCLEACSIFFFNKDPVWHLLVTSLNRTPYAHRLWGSPQELMDEGASETRPDMEVSRREAGHGGVGSRG